MAKTLLAVVTDSNIHRNVSAIAAKLAQSPSVDYITVYGRPADFARNSAVRMFLSGDWSHLFFLDSDTEPPLDCLRRLLALDGPLACGCYGLLMRAGLRWSISKRGSDGAYRLLEELPFTEQPFEVDGGGAGCLLIRRDCLDKLDWPWFKWIEKPNGTQISEDIYFFQKCNAAGFHPMIDPTVICRHHKEIDVTSALAAANHNSKRR